ncbi:MAG: ABC transporter permease [Hyphomicrobiales bacterium]|nr:ABC transporter permease [Hyphomicrobiales bacterium]
MSRVERFVLFLLSVLFVLLLLALLAPVAIVVLGSFYLDDFGNFDFSAPTLKWYAGVFDDRQIVDAMINTLIVGFGSVFAAIVIAILMALYQFWAIRRAALVLDLLIVLPFVLPPLVVGLSLLVFLREIGVPTGLTAVIIGHSLFVLAIVYRLIHNRLTQMGHSLIEAAMDLGATPMQTFWRVILPQIRGAIGVAAILAFTLSFDETLISLFLVGDQNTLPIMLWAMMRTGFSPSINALATLILTTSLLMIWLAARRDGSRRAADK